MKYHNVSGALICLYILGGRDFAQIWELAIYKPLVPAHQMQEIVERMHPSPLYEVKLHDVGVKRRPVDDRDPEGHRGEGRLQAPREGVEGWQPVLGHRGTAQPTAQHNTCQCDSTCHLPPATCVHQVVEGEQSYALVGHVDEPLRPQGVQSGHKVEQNLQIWR